MASGFTVWCIVPPSITKSVTALSNTVSNTPSFGILLKLTMDRGGVWRKRNCNSRLVVRKNRNECFVSGSCGDLRSQLQPTRDVLTHSKRELNTNYTRHKTEYIDCNYKFQSSYYKTMINILQAFHALFIGSWANTIGELSLARTTDRMALNRGARPLRHICTISSSSMLMLIDLRTSHNSLIFKV